MTIHSISIQSRAALFSLVLAVVLTAIGITDAHASVSPSGVDWSTRHVLALECDDLGSGEFNMSCQASTRYGMNVPWTGEQWYRIATALRGHNDALGVQIPLTLYMVAAFMEPDFTPVISSSSLVFNETFSGSLPTWGTFGSHQPIITGSFYVSAPVSARFNTPSPASDGWARRWITECKEYEVTFWYRIDSVQARTHLVSLTGPMGRAMGIEVQSGSGMLYLREGYFEDEILTPIGSYETSTWRMIRFRQLAGRVQVDMDANGSIELDKPTAFLPALANQVVLGDVSTVVYSGTGCIDDLVVTRWDNVYPAVPLVTPIDIRFPDVITAVKDNRDVFRVLCHGLTHGNDAEVQRRYAAGVVDDLLLPELNWWREDYDAVNDAPLGVVTQYNRLTLALDILETAFGGRSPVHVSPGNVYGTDTDAALVLAGVEFHETLTSGGGTISAHEPEVFWSVRTGSQELFYRQPDPNPLLSARLATAVVDSLFAQGNPAIVQTHAFNALVDSTGAALALFYDRLLDSLVTRYPDLVALTMDEMAALERDGRSVSEARAGRIYARNYLSTPHQFRVALPENFTADGVLSLPQTTPVPFVILNDEVIFTAGEGDYAIDLRSTLFSDVGAGILPHSDPGVLRLNVWPNPARGRVSLEAYLPVAGPVRMEILDVSGRRVHQAEQAASAAGPMVFAWDGRGTTGGPMAPGVYLARLEWTGGVTQAKILLAP